MNGEVFTIVPVLDDTGDIYIGGDFTTNNGQVVNWWYQKDAPDNVVLAELQRRARKSGLGLWADPHPVPPWCFRKKQSRDECEVGTTE
jgi:hypothetical protein